MEDSEIKCSSLDVVILDAYDHKKSQPFAYYPLLEFEMYNFSSSSFENEQEKLMCCLGFCFKLGALSPVACEMVSCKRETPKEESFLYSQIVTCLG